MFFTSTFFVHPRIYVCITGNPKIKIRRGERTRKEQETNKKRRKKEGKKKISIVGRLGFTQSTKDGTRYTVNVESGYRYIFIFPLSHESSSRTMQALDDDDIIYYIVIKCTVLYCVVQRGIYCLMAVNEIADTVRGALFSK